jgi:hypothetical protein
MRPAEAADELRTMTALNIANPKRLVALEMAIKRLLQDAAQDPASRCKIAFSSLKPSERATVVDDYCPLCWQLGSKNCDCVKDG